MSHEVETFQFAPRQNVRIVTINDQPWFVASDLAKILGYRDAATAIRLLRARHQGYAKVVTPGGPQQMIVVSEHGLYRLVLRSNASNAEQVQDWVTDHVMPAIRRTGSYSVTQTPALPQSYADALRELASSVEAKEAAEAALAIATPKVEAFDQFLDRDGLVTIGAAAKTLGVGQNRLFAALREHGVLLSSAARRNQPRNDLVPRYFVLRDNGYVDDHGRAHTTTMVTAECMDYLRRFISRHGVNA